MPDGPAPESMPVIQNAPAVRSALTFTRNVTRKQFISLNEKRMQMFVSSYLGIEDTTFIVKNLLRNWQKSKFYCPLLIR